MNYDNIKSYKKECFTLSLEATFQEKPQGGVSNSLPLPPPLPSLLRVNKNAWLKPYIDINTWLRRKARNNFEKDFTKLISNADFRKTLENMRKHGDIKLVATERRRNYLLSESYKVIHRNFISNRKNKNSNINDVYNKPVYLTLSILDLSKTVLY